MNGRTRAAAAINRLNVAVTFARWPTAMNAAPARSGIPAHVDSAAMPIGMSPES